MAGIDTSIYGQIQPAKVDSPLNALAQVMQVQHAQSQNKLADMLLSQKEREISDTSALNDAYRTAVGADGKIDRTKLYTGIAAGGMGSKLPAVQKSFADADEATYKAQAGQIKVAVDKLNAVGQVLGGVKDQASYDAARLWAVNNLGPDAVKNMPAVYDPQLIDAKRREALTVQQQLEQQWKTLDYKLNVDKFDETKRHNRADEGIAVRGQNMTDSRAREQIAAGKVPAGYRMKADGSGLEPIPGGPAEKDKALTESQGKATTFAARMSDADATLKQLEASGVTGKDLRTIAAGNNWTNWLASPEGQQYRQAQENWVTANLRQESGAVIGKEEMEKDIRKFFPVPGDSPQVIAQKTQAREVARQGMLTQAGPGAKSVGAIVDSARKPSARGAKPTAPAPGVPDDIAALLKKHGGK